MATKRASLAARCPEILQLAFRPQISNVRSISCLAAGASSVLSSSVVEGINNNVFGSSNLLKRLESKVDKSHVSLINSISSRKYFNKAVEFTRKIENPPPRRSLPSEPIFELQLTIKAFETRYIDMAVNTLRDLLMIHFTPKKFDSMESTKFGDSARPENPIDVYIPQSLEDLEVDWKKTRFTLIRGVFANKNGMEQFERREYHKRIKAVTTSVTELQWFLDSLRLYEFTGVQIESEISTSGYIAPHEHQAILKSASSSTSPDVVDSAFLNDGSSLLGAGHLRHIKDYLPSSSTSDAAAASGSSFGGELQASLTALRTVMHEGLEDRRRALGLNSEYDSWLRQQQRVGNPAATRAYPVSGLSPDAADPFTAVGSNPSDLATALLKSQVSQISSDIRAPLSSTSGAGGVDSEEGGKDLSANPAVSRDRKVAAFLAAVDAVFLNLRFDALEGHGRFPFHFATAIPGDLKVPVAMWMQAMAKMGEYQKAAAEAGKEADLLKNYAAYSSFSQSLLYRMLQIWFETNAAEAKEYLALPSWEEYERMVKSA